MEQAGTEYAAMEHTRWSAVDDYICQRLVPRDPNQIISEVA